MEEIMENFGFNYDEENDDLFAYKEGGKSAGAVELGNFVLDFDDKGNLVAMEILEASKILAKILSKIMKLAKIKEIRVNIVNLRNMAAIKFEIATDSERESANILIPHIIERSPALSY
ncbi:MAG: DUF2283 domain-containing protein [Candidatus Pacearchaeota archaeon]|nr:DUF2283 domain-containing protein [Candidatus Pacearchaeota archaeon]